MLEIDENIIEYVRENPKSSQNQVISAMDYSYSYCYQRIKRLVKSKKLQEQREQQRVLLSIV
jgi:DNA-binding Lrp family transcriptional regulator